MTGADPGAAVAKASGPVPTDACGPVPRSRPHAPADDGEGGDPKRFRADINGLRAIAVCGVVAFHDRLGFFRAGFVGVDVFFVISGFLMAEIISRRLALGRFSLRAFYLARARRILPALLTLIIAVLAVGLFTLDPLRLALLAKDAAASLVFASNVLYLSQGGYFAAPPSQNWLLHTWSLSVEWQFYIVFPLVLLALDRFGMGARVAFAILAAVIVLSFGKMLAGAFTGGGKLEQSFYLLPTRAWEFGVGAACAYSPGAFRRRMRIALQAAGLALIVGAMAMLDPAAPWPSAFTCLPVAGTALVILARFDAPFWARVFPVRWIGQSSYSIYLVHWPLFAIASTFRPGLPAEARFAGAGLALALGVASYLCIERRWTRSASGRPRHAWANVVGLIGLYLAVLGIAVAGMATHGLEDIRFAARPGIAAALRDAREARDDWAYPRDCERYTWDASNFSTCAFGDRGGRQSIVIGDSFAEAVTPRYRGSLVGSGRGVTFLTSGGCLPLPDLEKRITSVSCDRWVRQVFDYARTHAAARLVFMFYWASYDRSDLCPVPNGTCVDVADRAAFERTLDAGFRRLSGAWRDLKAMGRSITVIGSTPYGIGDPSDLYADALAGKVRRSLDLPLRDFETAQASVWTRLSRAAADAGVTLVDPAPALCPKGLCPFVADGHALYKDSGHLRASLMKDPRFAVLDRYILPGAP